MNRLDTDRAKQALPDRLSELQLVGAKVVLARIKSNFYDLGNKRGRGLARALRRQKGRSFIPKYRERMGQEQ